MSKLYKRTTVGEVFSNAGTIGTITLTATTAGSATLTDGNGGAHVIDLVCPANGSMVVPLKGVAVSTNVYLSAVSGTGATVHVEMI